MIGRVGNLATCAALLATSSHAQAQGSDGAPLQQGAGVEFFASTDADHTDIVRFMARGLLDYKGPDNYRGIALERVWFTHAGQETEASDRVYLDLGDKSNNHLWKLRIGTDGHTVLGTASIRNDDWSHEFFVEREIVETPIGFRNRIYYTFAGASFDIPADAHNVFTVMGGVQKFSGDNTRFHLRANYIHVVKAEWGLSVQLRARYYHSTEPGEFDYYSPRNYVQFLPVIQLRRFDKHGWEYRLRAAYGGEFDTISGWHESRYANLFITSPASAKGWAIRYEATYSNSSPTSGPGYYYWMGSLGIEKSF